jgi:hypothetical protein
LGNRVSCKRRHAATSGGPKVSKRKNWLKVKSYSRAGST